MRSLFKSLLLAPLGLVLGAAAGLARAPEPPVLSLPPSAPPVPAKPAANADIFLSADGETVYVIGMMMDDAFIKFDTVLRSAPRVRTVYLASPGGLTIEGRLIAALVRKRGLSTYVESYCASACTQVFVAGRERVLGKDAQLGFHQAVMVDSRGRPTGVRARTTRRLSSTLVFGINGNDTLRLAYELAGIDKAFIDKALARDHDDIWLPSTRELVDAHVITRRADRVELPVPKGTLSREEVDLALKSRPMWSAAAGAIPAAQAKARDEVWRLASTGTSLQDAISAGRSTIVLAALPMLKRSSDSLLDRMLQLYAGAARKQRSLGYPMCRIRLGMDESLASHGDHEFEEHEDQLLVELFGSAPAVPALDPGEATRIFKREVEPSLALVYRNSTLSKSESDCRFGLKTFEAIDALPAKKRIKSYRALLSLPSPDGE